MPKRKAIAAGAGRQSKRSKAATMKQAFIWKPREWTEKRTITPEVSVLASRITRKSLVVRKVLPVDASSSEDESRPFEIRALSLLADCNRIVKPLLYLRSNPDPQHDTIFFQHYPLGDLEQWKEKAFDRKNNKPVPESYIWRCFLQISQALAFLQNQIGPDREERRCMLHRDIKPDNILVVDNGTTYPSFKLHDFDCAAIYKKEEAHLPELCGTFQWQPPENPIINTRAADVWALGACIHYLATGKAPTEDISDYADARFNEQNRDPDSADEYETVDHYYCARAPRRVTPINLSTEEQQRRGIYPWNPQYSDELNEWMSECLTRTPSRRPTVEELLFDMGAVAKRMLKIMGRKAALVDLDAKFGVDA